MKPKYDIGQNVYNATTLFPLGKIEEIRVFKHEIIYLIERNPELFQERELCLEEELDEIREKELAIPHRSASFSELEGKTLVCTSIDNKDQVSLGEIDTLELITCLLIDDNNFLVERWRLQGDEDCCCSAYLEDVEGSLLEHRGKKIISAYILSSDDRIETDHDDDDDDDDNQYIEYAFYHLRTTSGSISMRWNKEQSDHYSTEVNFSRVDMKKITLLEEPKDI